MLVPLHQTSLHLTTHPLSHYPKDFITDLNKPLRSLNSKAKSWLNPFLLAMAFILLSSRYLYYQSSFITHTHARKHTHIHITSPFSSLTRFPVLPIGLHDPSIALHINSLQVVLQALPFLLYKHGTFSSSTTTCTPA